MTHIAIFASGGGSNAEALVRHFQAVDTADIVLICTNNPSAGVIGRAKRLGIPCEVLSATQYRDGAWLQGLMETHAIDLVVLAGYLKLIPSSFTRHFDQRIVNIHPALLPAYGGKGMYGMNVHKAVISSGEKVSGMTIHYVNEVYDEGKIIFQAQLMIEEDWTAEDLQQAVLKLEHTYFPPIIAEIATKIIKK